MKTEYGIIAFTGDPNSDEGIYVHYFFALPQPPTHEVYQVLYDDLKTNTEWGLTEIDFELAEATPEMIEEFTKSIQHENKPDSGV